MAISMSIESSSAKTSGRAYAILGGAWGAWLFDAMDSGVFSFVMLAIAHSFHTTLANVVGTMAWFLLATGIGGYLLGNIADYIGRKPTILISVFIYGVGTLLCGSSHSLGELNLYRFIVGIAVGGLWSGAASLVSEVWKPEGRAKALAILQTGWSGGNLLAAIFAWNILGANHSPEAWRDLFYISSIPALIVFVYCIFFVKESHIWIANKSSIRKNAKSQNPLEIFKPQYLRQTLFALIISIFTMIGYWMIITFAPTYLQSILHINIGQAPIFLVWTGIGGIVGYLVYGVLAEKIGRRHSFSLFFFFMVIMVPVFTFTASHMPLTNGKLVLDGGNVFTMGLVSALVGFGTGYFSGFGAWYSELFPTNIRSTASGFCFNFGRVGAIFGILAAPHLIKIIGFSLTISIASLTFFLAGILVYTLRETKGTIITSEN
ncbi:MFS transporter (plasmid) [Alicyclobacillus fastidiosus]|uniref:MFS transporter n=1 Tax=Alicyclobacillus fastidiosus TaxID=392011 RepID=A0ABY6ZQ26_9BACL|nr:MFS transporter [Alicyclobacillus fastidiosus]WAH44941.1 MFS transporter [Alicyclobacillus fastidiosus]GMA65594.1 MFS transporter [Alicyclobacillus fastidiosus]GMA65710.1 MFS transporter [Alicyclobacillus fastidiosus]